MALTIAAGLAMLAYLAGAIPFSFLVARARGVDLRVVGSGNVGASNVWRNCGFGAFLVALAGDMLKGALPVAVAQALGLAPLAVIAVGAAAMLGHTRSIFLGFRGGKAVATGGGVLLALAPLIALTGLVCWGIVFGATRIAAVASLSAAMACAIVAGVMFLLGALPLASAGFVWVAAVVIVALHHANIRRLRSGTENRFEKL